MGSDCCPIRGSLCLRPERVKQPKILLRVTCEAWRIQPRETMRAKQGAGASPPMAIEKTFQEACCEKLGIPEAAFEETVLWQCLPQRHLLIGKIRWQFDRDYFKDDLALIQSVKNCPCLTSLCMEVTRYFSIKPPRGFQRRFLRARLSGQSLINFASKLIPKH